MAQSSDFEAFLARYVNTNIRPGAPAYDKHLLIDDHLKRLERRSDLGQLAFHILVAQCCAMKRADLIGPLFRDNFGVLDNNELLEGFYNVRETVNIIWPFVGVPQVIPSTLGLAGYLESRGMSSLPADKQRLRSDLSVENTKLGTETRREIYKASANSEVFEMLTAWFGDLAYALDTVGFGYNMAGASSAGFSLAEVELILTAALIALGCTRQAGSHIKACIAFGWTEVQVEAIMKMADRLAEWQNVGHSPKIDVKKLAEDARTELAKKQN